MAQNYHVARRQVGVGNVLGLHLRAAGKFVRLANAFQSDVRVCCKGAMADGRSILSLLSLAAECGTMLALEAEGCDAEDAVAALANLISAQSHESEDQNGEAGGWSPKSRPTQGSPREGRSTESPESQKSDRSWKCGPRWDSWRQGSKAGPGIDRRTATGGRWFRGESHSGG
jgi:phosphocarrier protein HPr